MDRKRNQATLKGKEKVRAPPTRMSPRLTALRVPQSPPLKMRTPPSRASPRLAALKDSLFPPSSTSILIPKKLVVLALTAPKPTPPSVTPTQRDPKTLISEMPRVPKMRRTTRISVKPVGRQFSEGVIAKGRPSTAATKEKFVINDNSDNEISKKIKDANMEVIAMDEPFVLVEEDEKEEEEEEDPEEDPDEEEEGEIEYFRDEEDYDDYFSAEDDDSFDGSIGSN
ncbi:hypothetical protein PIB30_077182 [Stylosanthes scabra]|uniref:Uncharacterized protein n=1 Tax=Stylosanthes scabra TaxID=79078 RepID=A0ABU6TQ32_9FABA|nr:hypothetical protein [Stylosanthes scabra]